ncbi:hypothetical protein D2V08_12130 [Flagellimonas lutimaris]|uniref:Uncharacterized protein n=1 Tax=Flagellimonas lutimaris TaxID=475082 RepID=A0A3A1N503_9FLAO|nr:hypothetical protein [Allomuricauda lutimaris]RIV32459.1 hypothetical protein D2V08_12130 [Allomuricauda lutimaris]|tara:strand:- start:639 stop:974 length:336 start_codon:yes stop_codon:yes gene_type:complete
MRKFKAVSVALALFATMSVFATKGKKATKETNLSGQIYEMLKDNKFNVEYNELTAEVRFIVNEKGELVVLSVETKDEILEGFVKNRLNYQKVQLKNVAPGRVYEIPIRITA